MPIQEQTKDEKPVFITTFKSVQNKDGETVIESENKMVTQEQGVLVEEVLSDTETIKEQDETAPYQIEIVEVNDITGIFFSFFFLYYYPLLTNKQRKRKKRKKKKQMRLKYMNNFENIFLNFPQIALIVYCFENFMICIANIRKW